MKKIICFIGISLMSFSLAIGSLSSSVFAAKPEAQGTTLANTPAGWTQGQKKGWEDSDGIRQPKGWLQGEKKGWKKKGVQLPPGIAKKK